MNIRIGYLVLIAVVGWGQTASTGQAPARIIEVRGSAERSVTPNEFIFNLTLRERFEKKDKITISEQEKNLRDALTKIGIDVQKDLSIVDLDSNFGYVPGRKRKDVLGVRNYRLKLTDLAKVDQLQDIAENLDWAQLRLGETRYSDIATLRKQTKNAAVAGAKEKAASMLSAIGEKVGRAILIQELPEEDASVSPKRNVLAFNDMMKERDSADSSASLAFSEIKVHYVVLARFEIE